MRRISLTIVCLLILAGVPHSVSAQDRPVQTGANIAATATTSFQTVGAALTTAGYTPAHGTCYVTFRNDSATKLCTGYSGVTCTTGVFVCNDSSTCSAGPVYTRDVASTVAGFRVAAGTLTVYIEVGGGCIK